MWKRKPSVSSPTQYLRMILGAVGAGLGALAVVEARSWNQVLLTIGVTEWGHLVSLLGFSALVGRRHTPADRFARVLGLVATGLSLSSLARGAVLARRLPARLAAAFGDAAPREPGGAPARPAPLVALDVLRGIRSPRVRKERLVYATREGLALGLDLYRADDERPTMGDRRRLDDERRKTSCVLVIHGGSWQGGDSDQLPALNRYLAARGYVVAAINYRLAPTHRFPAQRDDILAAIAFLKTNAGELGIDPDRFVLLGRSAGGHLALLTAYTARDPAIRGVVSFYAPTDLLWGYNHPTHKRVIDGCAVIEALLGGNPTEAPDAYTLASPLSFAGTGCPPTLLIHGGRDNLVSPRQSEMLAERLRANHCKYVYVNFPWATHACDANLSGPSGQISTYAVERFLAAVA